MDIDQERKLNLWFILAGILWSVLGGLCIIPALAVLVFYDSPICGRYGLIDTVFIYSALAFPPTSLASVLGILLLKKKYKEGALFVSLLPMIPLVLVGVVYAWSATCRTGSTIQEQGHAVRASTCALPAVDGGDGLVTTGCGVLEVGVITTGATNSPSEAQNWQFSARQGQQMTISVENDGQSCPHIRILDLGGQVIESFKDRNDTPLCLSGMITTSFFYFRPSTDGVYILRLVTPTTPGAYWLKIE